MFSQVQDLTLVLAEFHKVLIRPLFQPIQVFLQRGSLEVSTSPLSLLSLPDFIRIHLITSSRSSLKILNTFGPYIHPWGTPCVTGCQSENKLFLTPLCVQPIKRLPHPPHSPPQEAAVGNCTENIGKIQVDKEQHLPNINRVYLSNLQGQHCSYVYRQISPLR